MDQRIACIATVWPLWPWYGQSRPTSFCSTCWPNRKASCLICLRIMTLTPKLLHLRCYVWGWSYGQDGRRYSQRGQHHGHGKRLCYARGCGLHHYFFLSSRLSKGRGWGLYMVVAVSTEAVADSSRCYSRFFHCKPRTTIRSMCPHPSDGSSSRFVADHGVCSDACSSSSVSCSLVGRSDCLR